VADRELSDQEKAFVLAYLGEARQHKKRAATLAGYSERSAHVAATRLLKRPQIKQALSQKRLELERDLAISVDRVAQELARIGFMDVRRLFNEDGRLKPIDELDADTAAAISSVKLSRERTTTSNGGDIKVVTEEAIVEVKLCPKVEALIALCRTLGLFEDKAKVSGRITLEQLVAGSMKPETRP
jgi:phage terminase small subunit